MWVLSIVTVLVLAVLVALTIYLIRNIGSITEETPHPRRAKDKAALPVPRLSAPPENGEYVEKYFTRRH